MNFQQQKSKYTMESYEISMHSQPWQQHKISMYSVAGKAITSLLTLSRKYNKVSVKVTVTRTILKKLLIKNT